MPNDEESAFEDRERARTTSPRRAVTRQIFRQLKTLGAAISFLRELGTYAQPRWALEPDDVPTAPDQDAGIAEVTVDLTPARLAMGRSTLARAIADIRNQSHDDSAEQVRPVGTWLSLDTDTTIGVHIGRYQIAELTGPETQPIRAAIQRWGAGTETLRAHANLLGSSPDTAHLEMWVQTPTDHQ